MVKAGLALVYAETDAGLPGIFGEEFARIVASGLLILGVLCLGASLRFIWYEFFSRPSPPPRNDNDSTS